MAIFAADMLNLAKYIQTIMILLLTVLPVTALSAGELSTKDVRSSCPEVKIEVEQLPDLNIPRASHELFCVNGEYVVAGGHTNGFVPVPTAEYYQNGEWHLVQMVYNHDFGSSLVMKSGQVLLVGGVEQPIGIGQTYLAELYNPVSHTFEAFGSLQRKRTGCSTLELDNGQVVIAGNWYHDDGIELFDGQTTFSYIKDVAIQRSCPYIFQMGQDDALIVGSQDVRGDSVCSYVADRLKGDTLHIPLLETWSLLPLAQHHEGESFIGDEQKGQYTYLIPVRNRNGQMAIAKVDNGSFTLLPTACPVPVMSQWGGIEYISSVIVDSRSGKGYLLGIASDFRELKDQPHRYYLLCIDYGRVNEGGEVPLTLYYTDPMMGVLTSSTLTDDGNILLAGGMLNNSNFTPAKAVYLLCVGHRPESASRVGIWIWVLLAILGLSAIFLMILLKRHRRKIQPITVEADPLADASSAVSYDELMDRICQLMDKRQLFLKSELKVADIATELGIPSRTVSDCIKSVRQCKFSDFVNAYRVDYAKKLMRRRLDMKISEVFLSSGFANENTFFRTFKAVTGMTPSEWKRNEQSL